MKSQARFMLVFLFVAMLSACTIRTKEEMPQPTAPVHTPSPAPTATVCAPSPSFAVTPISSLSPSPLGLGTPSASSDLVRAPADLGCLAFQTTLDDTIWVLTGGNIQRPVAKGGLVSLSPDGHFIIFYRSFPTQAWLIATDGSNLTQLFTGRPMIYGVAWSPDSRAVLFTTGADIKHMPTNDLWRVEVPNGRVTQLASAGAGGPVFSPDGHWIASKSTHWSPQMEVGLMHSDGESQRELFNQLISASLEWAYDSSGFALALKRLVASDPSETELWWVPIDGSPRQLGHLTDACYVLWEPGAERLVYSSCQDYEQAPLYLAQRDGSGVTAVPGSEGMEWACTTLPSWSHDGHWLLTVARASGRYYLVDTWMMSVPQPLDWDSVHGWLDGAHYLTGSGEDLYRCVPYGNCERIAHVPGGVSTLRYAR